jgi:hypothetical protein
MSGREPPARRADTRIKTAARASYAVMKPSPKITAAAIAGAVATIIWTIVATVSPDVFTETAIATLTGSTTTIVAAVLG